LEEAMRGDAVSRYYGCWQNYLHLLARLRRRGRDKSILRA
jgi:hypothetical protein